MGVRNARLWPHRDLCRACQTAFAFAFRPAGSCFTGRGGAAAFWRRRVGAFILTFALLLALWTVADGAGDRVDKTRAQAVDSIKPRPQLAHRLAHTQPTTRCETFSAGQTYFHTTKNFIQVNAKIAARFSSIKLTKTELSNS